MSRLWPRSLPSWILLVVILALAVAQAATLYNVNTEVERANRATDLFRLGERAVGLARQMQDLSPAQRQDLVNNLKTPTFSGELDSKPAITSIIAADDELAEMEDLLMAKLSTEGVLDLRIDRRASPVTSTAAPSGLANGDPGSDVAERLTAVSNDFAESGRFMVAMQLADRSWLNFSVPMTPQTTLLRPEGLPVYLAILAFVFALCLWAVLQLTAPYRRLERAVTQISSDLNTPPLAESGSREARATIRAVNSMQSRLRDYVSDRENLAAALAHDLRTPLTRMKLRCELMRASKDKQQLHADIEQLEAIVSSVIDFASIGRSQQQSSRVDVVSLLATICDDFPNAQVAPETQALHRLVINAHPVQLGRCLRNLVENAVRYGGSARASVVDLASHVEIHVDDDGPGIPEEMLATVIKPFVRLESSRNQEFGGTGLGLAIAESVARAHGGRLTLQNRRPHGLCAILSLPKSPPVAA